MSISSLIYIRIINQSSYPPHRAYSFPILSCFKWKAYKNPGDCLLYFSKRLRSDKNVFDSRETTHFPYPVPHYRPIFLSDCRASNKMPTVPYIIVVSVLIILGLNFIVYMWAYKNPRWLSSLFQQRYWNVFDPRDRALPYLFSRLVFETLNHSFKSVYNLTMKLLIDLMWKLVWPCIVSRARWRLIS